MPHCSKTILQNKAKLSQTGDPNLLKNMHVKINYFSLFLALNELFWIHIVEEKKCIESFRISKGRIPLKQYVACDTEICYTLSFNEDRENAKRQKICPLAAVEHKLNSVVVYPAVTGSMRLAVCKMESGLI